MKRAMTKRYLTTTCGVPAAHFLSFGKGGLLTKVDNWGTLYERMHALASQLPVEDMIPINDAEAPNASISTMVLNALLEGNATYSQFLGQERGESVSGRRLSRRSSAMECQKEGCNQLHRYADGFCHMHRSRRLSRLSSSASSVDPSNTITIWKNNKPTFRTLIGANASFEDTCELAKKQHSYSGIYSFAVS